MKTTKTYLCLVCLFALVAGAASASGSKITGVFGLAPVVDGAALAVWVPLESGESISGVMWYNNDGNKAFPELLAVAGSADHPSVLDQAVVVGENVGGLTLEWSEYVFSSPYASETSGLFLVFRLPLDGAFVAEGEGAGLGYQLGDGKVRCWVSTGEGEWGKLSPEYQMAVMPVMNPNKSAEVIVLGVEEQLGKPEDESDQSGQMISGLRIVPNPFNPRTKIAFSLKSGEDVTLAIYDVRGRKVVTLVSGPMAAGDHGVEWNGVDGRGQQLPSGVYFSQLKAGAVHLTGRMTLVR